jgi:hypothetical protein
VAEMAEKKVKIQAVYEGSAKYANLPTTLWGIEFEDVEGKYIASVEESIALEMIEAGRAVKL